MKDKLECLYISSLMSYKELERLLEESELITDRDIQVLKNFSFNFFKTINILVSRFPEGEIQETNEIKKENKNNDEK